MSHWHLLFPVDYSSATRAAIPAVARLAGALDARVTGLAVEPRNSTPATVGSIRPRRDVIERLRTWLVPEVEPSRVSVVVRYGLPGVEISRQADECEADLIVLVRKARSDMAREVLGDTVDAVIRRATVPALIFHREPVVPQGMVVALPGAARDLRVLGEADRLARAMDWPLAFMTVEPPSPAEAMAMAVIPSPRSVEIGRNVGRLRGRGHATEPVLVRRGDVVEELLAEMVRRKGWGLAIGYRRGGPPGILEAGSVARRVVHRARCPVLTVPL